MSWIGWLCLVRAGLSFGLGSPRLASLATLLAVPFLVWASRGRTRPVVMAGALLPLLGSVVTLSVRALSLNLEQGIVVLRLEILALLIWGFAWGLWRR